MAMTAAGGGGGTRPGRRVELAKWTGKASRAERKFGVARSLGEDKGLGGQKSSGGQRQRKNEASIAAALVRASIMSLAACNLRLIY
jgi:hypothetical protein